MEVGLVHKVDIDHEMQQSYLDYAMSVIVARAIPDARDGLKPVQRRILYAMNDMGLRAEGSFKKSARIVGEVLGKYHPHGDVAVYEAMARLAQDFSVRYMLVEGQGNFGSVDGDPPAAMRYTEARLSPFATQILKDIDRATVDFTRNFDDSLDEPLVLPSAAPNMLVNGATGIAVGMATNIPPHNLGEVVDASVFLLKNWDRMDDIPIDELMNFVQGPDFPTGGIILQENENNELFQAYATGRGRITVRGRVRKEDMDRGRSRLIITEIPYMTNKSSLIERIAELVRGGQLEGISDLRDESDRHGMRIVIELNKAAEAEQTLLALYKHTPLQSTFGINMLALVGGEPRTLSLKQSLRVYLEHRIEVVRRRAEFDLDRARRRAHILEGLRTAIANLDEIIALIRAAPDVETARTRLIRRFKFSDVQAQAVLEMPLRRLAALERKKIEEEYKGLVQLIKDLESLLQSPKKMRETIAAELLEVKEQYGDRRRTQVVTLREGESARELLMATDLTPSQLVWVGVTAGGQIGRMAGEELTLPSGEAAPRLLIRADTHHTIYMVNETGRAASLMVETIPEVESFASGVNLEKVSPLDHNEKLAGVFTLPPGRAGFEDRFVLTVTRAGLVKKTALSELPGPSAQAFTLVKVNPDDVLSAAHLAAAGDGVLLVSAAGMAIRFAGQDVRPMGLVAAGVNGIKLKSGDVVVASGIAGAAAIEVLLLASDGKGWRIPLSEFPQQSRYGQGIIAAKLAKGALLVGALVGDAGASGLVFCQQASPRLVEVASFSRTKRLRTPEVVMTLKPGDLVLEITPVVDGLAFWEPEADKKKPGKTGKPGPKKVSVKTQKATAVELFAASSAPAAKAPAAAKKTAAAAGKPARAKKAAGKPAKVVAKPSAPVKKTSRAAAVPVESEIDLAKKIVPPEQKLAAAEKPAPAPKSAAGKPALAAPGKPVLPQKAAVEKKTGTAAEKPAKGKKSAAAGREAVVVDRPLREKNPAAEPPAYTSGWIPLDTSPKPAAGEQPLSRADQPARVKKTGAVGKEPSPSAGKKTAAEQMPLMPSDTAPSPQKKKGRPAAPKSAPEDKPGRESQPPAKRKKGAS